MGLGGLLHSGWTRTPRELKQAFCLGALLLFVVGFLPIRAAAQMSGSCPGQITQNLTLTANITASAGQSPCITVGGNNLSVNLGQYTIDVSALGNTGIAIETGTTTNTSIIGNGGAIITNYTTSGASAIDVQGGTNVTITGVTIENDPNGTQCANVINRTNEDWGNGITLDNVTGATISGNSVSCYQNGISVQNSAIPRHGAGSISGNTMTGNVYDMQATGLSGIYSAGLVLSNSSGWSVSGNTIENNGSTDVNSTCVSSPPNLISCSFGLQIINNSNNNSVENNTVNNNYVGGIYAGPDTSKNTISGNTALNNLPYDLWDDAPIHSNSWHHNTCTNAGGTLSSHTCH